MRLAAALLALLAPCARAAQVAVPGGAAAPGVVAPQAGLPGLPALPSSVIPGVETPALPGAAQTGVEVPGPAGVPAAAGPEALRPGGVGVSVVPQGLVPAVPGLDPSAPEPAKRLAALGEALAPSIGEAARSDAGLESSLQAGHDIETLLKGGSLSRRPALDLGQPSLPAGFAPTGLSPRSAPAPVRAEVPASARPPRRLVTLDAASLKPWLALGAIGVLSALEASGIAQDWPSLGAYGILGLYGGMMIVPEVLPDPSEVYPRAFKEASKVAAKAGYEGRELLFGEATASMPVRDGKSWHFTFHVRGDDGRPTGAVYVDFDSGLAASGQFYTNHAVYRGGLPGDASSVRAQDLASIGKGELVTADQAWNSVWRLAHDFSPAASVSFKAAADGRLTYRLFDGRGGAAEVDARTGKAVLLSRPAPRRGWGQALNSGLRDLGGVGSFIAIVAGIFALSVAFAVLLDRVVLFFLP